MSYELKDLKETYALKAEEYDLPSFEKINEIFLLESLDKESDVLLRIIRKHMMEKIVNIVGFLEMLLNPTSAPRMYMGFVNSMTEGDRSELSDLYKELSLLFISSLEIELDYKEKDEAELIKTIFSKWESSKDSLKKILEKIKKPAEVVKKEKNYFG